MKKLGNIKQPRNDRSTLWAMEEKHLRTFMAGAAQEPTEPPTEQPTEFYDEDVAIVPIVGPITKYQSLESLVFGGTASTEISQILVRLVEDPLVSRILLYVDSPGGSVTGTTDLAQLVAEVNSVKPVWAYVSDRCFSAAYWIASQCSKIICNRGGFVGSIGVYTVLYDTSQQAENEGVKVHLVKAGETKGAEEPGIPISDAALHSAQDEVNEIYSLFVADVAAGRHLTSETTLSLADGRIHVAQKAKALGLIDGIGTIYDAIQGLKDTISTMDNANVQEQVQSEAVAEPAPALTLETLQDQIASIAEQVASLALTAQKAEADKPEAVEAPKPEDRLEALKAVAPDRPDFAIAQFLKGNDASKAKAELADILAAENTALKAKVAQHARDEGQQPIAMKPTIASGDNLDAIWERNEDDVQAKYHGKKAYFLADRKHAKQLAKAAK